MSHDVTFPASPRDWHRRVWRLAAPIILSNISTPILGAVDTAVVGHLPDPAYIGGVSLGAVIFSFVFWGFGSMRMSATGLTAQALGAGDKPEFVAILNRSLLLAVVLGAAVILLQWPLAEAAFFLLEASARVEAQTAIYYDVLIWGAPAAVATFAASGWLIGAQRTTAALVVQLTLTGLNMVLDFVFVLGFGWGVAGVALATLISHYVALAVALVACLRVRRQIAGGIVAARILEPARLSAMFAINTDMFLRTLMLLFGFAYFTAESAKLGDVVLAANTVLLHLQNLYAFTLDGFAHAAEALVGQAFGARRRQAFSTAVRVSTIWACAFAVFAALIILALGPTLIDLMTGITDVRATAAIYLPWLIASPLLSVWSFQLDGIFVGATRSADMRNAMLLSLLVFLVAVWLLPPSFGNHGLWLALMLFMLGRGVTLAVLYPRLPQALPS